MPPKERDSIVEDFKSLKLKVVVQCKILTIGFDHPQLDAIISARPSNSLVFVYQIVGRGVRKHDLKKDCKIVDFSGNVEKFGRVEDLVIENSPLTKGWAVFSGENLLTNYPLNTKKRPTKKSLQSKLDWDKRKQEGNVSEVTFHFGRYKNKTITQVMKENKSYLTWLLDQKDFNWFGEKGKILKERIEQELGVFVKKSEPIGTNAFFQNYTQNIRSIKDLKNIW
jgi:superfamily II DNA or RNA helicase